MPDNERAVSEVIGFVLVFSLIALSIGTVYVVGFNGLQDTRNAQQIDNVERTFDVLADNIEDGSRRNAPSRATEFRLYDARLLLGEPTQITVNVTNIGGSSAVSVEAYPIVYESRRSPTTIRYVSGGVIRDRRGSGIFQADPGFVFRKNASDGRTAIIPIVQTRSAEREVVRGTKTVLVRTTVVNNEVLTERTTPSNATSDPDGDAAPEYNVTLRVRSVPGRIDLWESYLDRELTTAYPSLSDPCSVSGDTTTCVFPAERLYVTAVRVDTNIES